MTMIYVGLGEKLVGSTWPLRIFAPSTDVALVGPDTYAAVAEAGNATWGPLLGPDLGRVFVFEPPHPFAWPAEACHRAIEEADDWEPGTAPDRLSNAPDCVYPLLDPIAQFVGYALGHQVIHRHAQVLEWPEGCSMDWHPDRHPDKRVFADIRVSLVVQLSDPADYTGGHTEFDTANGPVTAPHPQGTVVAFDSDLYHRVTPITGGRRYSITAFYRDRVPPARGS